MSYMKHALPIAAIFPIVLGGCGLSVPEKQFLSDDTPYEDEFGTIQSSQGQREAMIVGHIKCEIQKAIWDAINSRSAFPNSPLGGDWLKNWGTSATLILTVDEQSSFNPGVSVTKPLGNAYNIAAGPNSLPLTAANLATPTIASVQQSFTLGLGGSASADSTRKETIQFTYTNKQLLDDAAKDAKLRGGKLSCSGSENGVMIEGDLKIEQFIFDKLFIAAAPQVASTASKTYPPFNTFTEEITFKALFGGSVTPTWRFIRVANNPSTQLLNAQRTDTSDLTITIGPLGPPASKNKPASLDDASKAQQQAHVAGALTGQSVNQ